MKNLSNGNKVFRNSSIKKNKLFKLFLIFSLILYHIYENIFYLLLIKLLFIPRISVIIPIFNGERFLSSCLNSVISQTLKNIEIICIDDGSKDESLNILKNYSKLDKRIIIISHKNMGPGIARNKGIAISKGKYISFMDSDDLYPDNFTLKLMYTKAIQNKVIICGGGLKQFIQKNNNTFFSKPIFYFNSESIINYNEYQFHFGFTRFIFNKNFIKKNKIFFPDYFKYEDPPFFVKAMIYSKKFYALKEITYFYRILHKENKWNIKMIMDQLNGFEDCIHYSKIYKLDNLYCEVIKNLNMDLFLTPIGKFRKNKQLIKKSFSDNKKY